MKNENTALVPALEVVKKSPDDWARIAYPSTRRGTTEIPHANYWQHKAAAALHGWADHAHHEGGAIQLTVDEYMGALQAATEPKPQKRIEKSKDKDGKEVVTEHVAQSQYVPHWPALSPHSSIAKQFAAIAEANKAAASTARATAT